MRKEMLAVFLALAFLVAVVFLKVFEPPKESVCSQLTVADAEQCREAGELLGKAILARNPDICDKASNPADCLERYARSTAIIRAEDCPFEFKDQCLYVLVLKTRNTEFCREIFNDDLRVQCQTP